MNLFGFRACHGRLPSASCVALIALAPWLPGYCAPAGSTNNLVSYAVKGVFMESRAAGRIAVIAHESIPGYMDAMTMPFKVNRAGELKGLQPGDKITFRLTVSDQDDWIDQIRRLGDRAAVARADPPEREAPKLLEPGALVADCVLTNQVGHTLHIADFKGQVLAFTFFFSRCPLPSFCPRMNNNFSAAQQTLKSDASRTNWQLLSISFDPGIDTPEHLNAFTKDRHLDTDHWSFATSSFEEIRKLGGSFGLKFWRENGSISHNLRTVVVDASGRVQRVFTGNEWEPAELVREMKKAMTDSP